MTGAFSFGKIEVFPGVIMLRRYKVFAAILLCLCFQNCIVPGFTTTAGTATVLGEAQDPSESGWTSSSRNISSANACLNSVGDDCSAVSPRTDSVLNATAILSCLQTCHEAYLLPGVFPIDRRIVMPADSTLAGLHDFRAEPSRASLLSFVGSSQDSVLSLGDRDIVRQLRVDGRGSQAVDCCTSVTQMGGNDSRIEKSEIFNSSLPAGKHITGIYVIGEHSANNVIDHVDVHDAFIGVIFRATLTMDRPNILQDSIVRETQCDGVSMGGAGKVLRNQIFHTGYDCMNGPIPGAAIYAIGNKAGAWIEGNHGYDTCGNGLDLVNSANFTILNNVLEQPGYTWGGLYPYCSGSPGNFANVRDFTFRENTFHVTDRAPIGQFANNPDYAQTFLDLPNGRRQLIALRLILSSDPAYPGDYAIHNTFEDNRFIATCSTEACVGLGLFMGRGTGLTTTWSADTTNYFRRNEVFGSNIGSVRCGGNWYAANDQCVSSTSGGDCNDDDFQHVPARNSNWSRNDNSCRP